MQKALCKYISGNVFSYKYKSQWHFQKKTRLNYNYAVKPMDLDVSIPKNYDGTSNAGIKIG